MRGAPIHVGVSVQAKLLGDPGYARTVARVFDTVTPENEMKWDTIEPERGKYDFGPADRVVDFARAHGLRVRGHVLVFHSQLPDWVTSGHFGRKQLTAILRDHIDRVVGHFRGRVAEWDVVNEAVSDDGRTLRPSVWLNTLGPA